PLVDQVLDAGSDRSGAVEEVHDPSHRRAGDLESGADEAISSIRSKVVLPVGGFGLSRVPIGTDPFLNPLPPLLYRFTSTTCDVDGHSGGAETLGLHRVHPGEHLLNVLPAPIAFGDGEVGGHLLVAGELVDDPLDLPLTHLPLVAVDDRRPLGVDQPLDVSPGEDVEELQVLWRLLDKPFHWQLAAVLDDDLGERVDVVLPLPAQAGVDSRHLLDPRLGTAIHPVARVNRLSPWHTGGTNVPHETEAVPRANPGERRRLNAGLLAKLLVVLREHPVPVRHQSPLFCLS